MYTIRHVIRHEGEWFYSETGYGYYPNYNECMHAATRAADRKQKPMGVLDHSNNELTVVHHIKG